MEAGKLASVVLAGRHEKLPYAQGVVDHRGYRKDMGSGMMPALSGNISFRTSRTSRCKSVSLIFSMRCASSPIMVINMAGKNPGRPSDQKMGY